MRRIKIVFALIAAVLSVPLLIMAVRAIQGAEAEVDAHHEAVARRLFDEMERALTDVLREEERRPYIHYRPAADALPAARPLAGPPAHPFVVGYFEIDPDGLFATPMADGPWPSGELATRLTTVREAVQRYDEGVRFDTEKRWAMAPGSTVSNLTGGVGSLNPLSRGKTSINAFNQGSSGRVGRGRRTEWVEPSTVPRTPAEGDVVSLGIDPLRGHLVESERMVLVRRIELDGIIIRQGLVLSVPALARWLVERTVETSPVQPHVTVTMSASPMPDLSADHSFTHRFGEPFDAVGASLSLASLPDSADAGTTWMLALGLLVAAPLGLFAAYRMTATTVGFAQRRSDFVSAVTHELKTPLTSIRMYGEMLRDGMVLDADKRQTYYGHISAEAERLSRLVDNVLELARLEKGTRAMNVVIGDPAAALREVAAVFGPQARKAGFTLEVDAPEDLPAARFDRDALVQVIFNLVDNAVKYAREADDRRILLTARLDGHRVALSVRDHGPGVPTPQLDRIFEPFYRGQREMTRTANGTGIGLALVTGLVGRMGGTVRGHNASGGGFEVSIHLQPA